MAKKGSKLLALAAISAAAAGTYYYLKNNKKEVPVNMGDDEEDDFVSEDLDETEEKAEKRPYVSLDLDTLEQKVRDAADKVTDVAGKAATQLGDVIKKGSERVEEFFDDRKTAAEPVVNSVDDYEETVEETAQENKTEE